MMPSMTLNILNSLLLAKFPPGELGKWKLEFTGFKAANPFSSAYHGNPLQWHLCAAQWWSYTPNQKTAYQLTLVMPEMVLKDEANMERIIGMVELYREYLHQMIAAAEVLDDVR